MKRVFMAFTLVFLGMAIAFGVCKEAPAQSPAEVIKLRFSDHNPPNAWGTLNGTEPWLKEIEKATNDRVKIERYYAETLVKGTDVWMALKSGTVDMGWCSHGYWPAFDTLV